MRSAFFEKKGGPRKLRPRRRGALLLSPSLPSLSPSLSLPLSLCKATPTGEYRVLLFKNGRWRPIRVNDRMPVCEGRAAGGRGAAKQLLFVKSAGNDELWPSLLEKAYAKVK